MIKEEFNNGVSEQMVATQYTLGNLITSQLSDRHRPFVFHHLHQLL